MGIIKATLGAVGGGLADQWLEVLEADDMGGTTLFTKGVKVRRDDRRSEKRSSNKKGTEDYISNGSIIHVYPGQFMMLVDGGKIVDFTAEEGYYKVDYASAPSMFSGGFGASLKESFSRIKFGGVPSASQKASSSSPQATRQTRTAEYTQALARFPQRYITAVRTGSW